MRRARALLASLLFQCILIAKVLKLWCRTIDPLALNRLRERQVLPWHIERSWEATPRWIHHWAESMPKASARGVEVESHPPSTCHLPLAFGHNAINPHGAVRSITKPNLTNVYVNYAGQTIHLALIHSIISCSPCVDSTWGAHPSNRFALEISATK